MELILHSRVHAACPQGSRPPPTNRGWVRWHQIGQHSG